MTSMALAQSPSETIFSFSRAGNAVVVTLAAPAVREWQASVLSAHLTDVVDRNRGRSVVVDVGGIRLFTCAWINALLGLTSRVARMGGQLVIVGFTRESRQMLRTTGLTKHFHLADTTQEALEMIGDMEPVSSSTGSSGEVSTTSRTSQGGPPHRKVA